MRFFSFICNLIFCLQPHRTIFQRRIVMTERKTIRVLEEAYRAVFQHLLVHKRKPSTFEEYRIAYARLCDFYIRHRVSSYDPVVSEMFRRNILRQYDNGMLGLNYRRLFIRLSVYVDNYFAGWILTARKCRQ